MPTILFSVLKLPSNFQRDSTSPSSRSEVWGPLIEHDDSAYIASAVPPGGPKAIDEQTERAMREGLDTLKSDLYPGSPSWEELLARLIPYPKAEDTASERVHLNVSVIKLSLKLDDVLSAKSPINTQNRPAWTEAHVATCTKDIATGDYTARTVTDLRHLVRVEICVPPPLLKSPSCSFRRRTLLLRHLEVTRSPVSYRTCMSLDASFKRMILVYPHMSTHL